MYVCMYVYIYIYIYIYISCTQSVQDDKAQGQSTDPSKLDAAMAAALGSSCPRRRTTSEVVVRRAVGLYFQQKHVEI